MRNRQFGFTLIELMVVVAVLGILAALAIAAYQDYLARTQMSEAMTLTSGAKPTVAEFLANYAKYPPTNASAGLASPESITGKYVSTVSVVNGKIIAYMRTVNVSPGIEGVYLALSPFTMSKNPGSIQWNCTSSAKPKYLPTVCRDD